MAFEQSVYFCYTQGGALADPYPAAIFVSGQRVTAHWFARPTAIGNTSVGPAMTDFELADLGVYRIWIDDGGAAPDADHALRQGTLAVNEPARRGERADYWSPYTPTEIEARRQDKLSELRGETTSRVAEISEHLGNSEDGIDLLKEMLIAARELAELGANKLGDWLRTRSAGWPETYKLDPPAVDITGGELTAVIAGRPTLDAINQIRIAGITVRGEIEVLTLYSAISAYDIDGRLDELLGVAP